MHLNNLNHTLFITFSSLSEYDISSFREFNINIHSLVTKTYTL